MSRATPPQALLQPTRLGAMAGLVVALSCVGPSEAARVSVPVEVSRGLEASTTDQRYRVELREAWLAFDGVRFAREGEAHAWLRPRGPSRALAHPGHYTEGEVTGELSGRFAVDFVADGGATLMDAELITGAYTSANFRFDFAPLSDIPGEHTAVLRGSASRDGETVNFVVVIDAPPDRELIGAPFAATIDAASAAITFAFTPTDPLEGDTLFDGVDFAALDADGDGELELSPDAPDGPMLDAYASVRRTFLTHDHYGFRAIP